MLFFFPFGSFDFLSVIILVNFNHNYQHGTVVYCIRLQNVALYMYYVYHNITA